MLGSLKRRAPYRDSRIFVIATEGSVTEPHYFKIFTDPDFGGLSNRRIKRIDILPTEEGKSAPNHVVARLDTYRDANDLGDGDQLWIVIDVDRWNNGGLLARVSTLAKQKGYFLAVSNPNFESWLLYHFIASLPDCSLEFTNTVAVTCGNTKVTFDLTPYRANLNQAIKNAKSDDRSQDDEWPQSHGSHVYKLVSQLMPRT